MLKKLLNNWEVAETKQLLFCNMWTE